VIEANDFSVSVRDNHDSARRAVSLELSIAGVVEDGALDVEQHLTQLAEQVGNAEACDSAIPAAKISDMNDSCSKK
jgi:hypothetical protein